MRPYGGNEAGSDRQGEELDMYSDSLIGTLAEVFLVGLTFILLILIAGAGLLWLVHVFMPSGC